MVEPSTSDEQLRQVALARIKKRRDFYWHLITYLVVNALLVFIWSIEPPRLVLADVGADLLGMGLAFHAW